MSAVQAIQASLVEAADEQLAGLGLPTSFASTSAQTKRTKPSKADPSSEPKASAKEAQRGELGVSLAQSAPSDPPSQAPQCTPSKEQQQQQQRQEQPVPQQRLPPAGCLHVVHALRSHGYDVPAAWASLGTRKTPATATAADIFAVGKG